MRTHLVIPDTQVKLNTPVDHLDWIGRYIVEMQPKWSTGVLGFC